MTFEECLAVYENDIRGVVAQYARGNWRLEKDDLYQEACLELWRHFSRILASRDPRRYIKHIVARRLAKLVAHCQRDALFNAVSLDQLEGYGIDIDEEGKPVMANPPHTPAVGG